MNLQDVMEIVVKSHEGQTRKGIFKHVPYVQHLFDVHRRVVHYLQTGDDDLDVSVGVMQAAALMHDLIEDTDVCYDDIESLYGKETADIVQELTRPADLKTRLSKYEFLEGYMEKSLEAVIVKVSDRHSNTLDYDSDPEKRTYASFYALQAYPVYQAYFSMGGENYRIIEDIKTLEGIAKRRYPHVSMFDDSEKMQDVIRKIAVR